jgi:pyruvate kinase
MKIIATLPPYVDHRQSIIDHPAVTALRFNTVSPHAEPRRDLLARLKDECGKKSLWIDLKGRQLRIAKFAYLPYAFVELSHTIKVDLPCDVHFKDCVSKAVRLVDGNKLILADRPVRIVGEGEPINILDESFRVDGYLTDGDREYIEAAASLGLHDYLLSFAESNADVVAVKAIDPKARCMAKIESRRGLAWMKKRPKGVRLMAARDDLYINMGADKADILGALEGIIAADRTAAVASKMLESLESSPTPSLTDLSDVALMCRMGYREFMLSDTLCFREQAFRAAAPLLASLLKKEGGDGKTK